MTRHSLPRTNPSMAALYLAMIEEVTGLADGHRRLARERLGAGGALRMRMLALLSEGRMDGRTPGELAARMQVPKQTVARVLTGLEADGLVERGAYRGDGRCKSIWITDIGGLALEELVRAFDADLRLLAGITQLQALVRAKSEVERMRKLQATCIAYRKRGVRRRVASG